MSDKLSKAVAEAGGTLVTVQLGPLPTGRNGGCGAPTRVAGTNGGWMPCGSLLTNLGKTEPYYCGACHAELNGKTVSAPDQAYKPSTKTGEKRMRMPRMSDFEVDQWNDPYPVPTIDLHYGPSQALTTTLDMRSITTAFQVHEALRKALDDCGDYLTEEEITGLLAEDSAMTITDPQGDCAYFYDAERGKFNMSQWAEFCKYKAPRVEKQAYLRIFGRWNGPHFTSHRIGRFVDTYDAINKALEAYQISPDWLIYYLDRPRLMKERLSNEIVSEECCWFWRGMQQSDSEWL